MPFFDQDKVVPIGVPTTPILSEHDEPDYTFAEAVGAAWEDTTIGSIIASHKYTGGVTHKIDTNFNTFDEAEKRGYVQHIEDGFFDDIFNKDDFEARAAQIEHEVKNDEVLEAAGWTGTALSFGAELFEPVNYLPAGALIRAGRVGYSTARSALSVGAASVAATSAQEAVLQQTQITRSATESAISIGGSAVLGGMFGGAAAKFLNKQEWDKFSKLIEEDFADESPSPADAASEIVTRARAMGAASVDEVPLEDLAVAGEGALGKTAKAIAAGTAALRINPGLETMLSPSPATRRIYNQLVDNPIYTSGNLKGETMGPAVENLMKRGQRGALGSFLKGRNTQFRAARKAGYSGKKGAFNEEIGMAARRNDLSDDNNAFVNEGAKTLREKIFTPYLKTLQSLGVLSENFKISTAPSYFTRLFNPKKMTERENRFKQTASTWLSKEFDEIVADEKLAGTKRDKIDFVSEEDKDDYIREITNRIFNNLTGRGDGDIPSFIVPATRGPLKERTFRIPDLEIEEFLENDAEIIARHYVRTAGAETELMKKFGRADMRDQLGDNQAPGEIGRDYENLRKEVFADKKLTEKQRNKKLDKLTKAEKRDLEYLRGFRDLLRGTYRSTEDATNWAQATRLALAWNYMRLLGGVTLTSVADLSRLVGVHGTRAIMTEAIPTLATNLKALKLSVQEASELGAVTETILNSRLASLSEITDPYAYGHPLQRMVDNATSRFSVLTGLGWWNDSQKGIAAVLTQNRVIKNSLIGNYAKLDKFERSYMAFLGLDENMANRIAKQYKAHGEKDGRVFIANTDKWDDQNAVEAYAAALNKDVDRTIITKGVTDQPFWTRTNTGKLIMQFKSFALAAHQRVLIAGLQERPHRFAEMMVTATALGMMIDYLKLWERDDEAGIERLFDNPGLWISGGIDRSGIFSIPMDVSNTLDKVWRGNPLSIKKGIQLIAGDEDLGGDVSRYASRNRIGAIAGPSAGIFSDVFEFASQVSEGELKKSGVNAAIRQIPGATLPGIKYGINHHLKPQLED